MNSFRRESRSTHTRPLVSGRNAAQSTVTKFGLGDPVVHIYVASIREEAKAVDKIFGLLRKMTSGGRKSTLLACRSIHKQSLIHTPTQQDDAGRLTGFTGFTLQLAMSPLSAAGFQYVMCPRISSNHLVISELWMFYLSYRAVASEGN